MTACQDGYVCTWARPGATSGGGGGQGTTTAGVTVSAIGGGGVNNSPGAGTHGASIGGGQHQDDLDQQPGYSGATGGPGTVV